MAQQNAWKIIIIVKNASYIREANFSGLPCTIISYCKFVHCLNSSYVLMFLYFRPIAIVSRIAVCGKGIKIILVRSTSKHIQMFLGWTWQNYRLFVCKLSQENCLNRKKKLILILQNSAKNNTVHGQKVSIVPFVNSFESFGATLWTKNLPKEAKKS